MPFGTDPNVAASIANTLSEVYIQSNPSFRVITHETASIPSHHIANNRLLLLIGGIAGLLLSPFLALGLMALLHRKIPDKRPAIRNVAMPLDEGIKARSRLTFVLFLCGTLGTLILMVLSPRHDIALIFGAVCLLIAFIVGIMSWRAPLSKFVVIFLGVIPVVIGPLAIVSAFYFRLKNVETAEQGRIEAEQTRLQHETELRILESNTEPATRD